MKKVYVVIILLIAISLYLFIALKIGGERAGNLYYHFNTSSINGELEYVEIKYHNSAFKIIGEDDEYCFDPITSELNDYKIFLYTAEKGDLVIKEAHSDILRLKKKDGKVYMYKFRDPND
jgi:hypothetical protein